MKIIAKTGEGYMATVSVDEVRALLALNDSRRSEVKEKITIGTELSFTIALQNLNLIKDVSITDNYKSLYKLVEAKEELEKVIKMVEGLKVPIIEIKEQIKTGQA